MKMHFLMLQKLFHYSLIYELEELVFIVPARNSVLADI